MPEKGQMGGLISILSHDYAERATGLVPVGFRAACHKYHGDKPRGSPSQIFISPTAMTTGKFGYGTAIGVTV
jgi:hypothetical protein